MDKKRPLRKLRVSWANDHQHNFEFDLKEIQSVSGRRSDRNKYPTSDDDKLKAAVLSLVAI